MRAVNALFAISLASLFLAAQTSPALAEDPPPPPAPEIETAPPEGSAAPTGPVIVPPAPINSGNAEPKTEPQPGEPTQKELDEAKAAETDAQKQAEVPPPPSAETESPSSGKSSANVVDVSTDEPIPEYQLARPNFAVQLLGSLNALGGAPAVTTLPNSKAAAIVMDVDYEPSFLQSIGVVAIGVGGGILPVSSGDANVTIQSSTGSFWQVGGHIKYQARLFREQIIVPTVGYTWERMTYKLSATDNYDGFDGNVSYNYPSFGAMFLLNVLEPRQANELYHDWHIKRTYLAYELRSLTAKEGTRFPGNGATHYFGLRVEF